MDADHIYKVGDKYMLTNLDTYVTWCVVEVVGLVNDGVILNEYSDEGVYLGTSLPLPCNCVTDDLTPISNEEFNRRRIQSKIANL